MRTHWPGVFSGGGLEQPLTYAQVFTSYNYPNHYLNAVRFFPDSQEWGALYASGDSVNSTITPKSEFAPVARSIAWATNTTPFWQVDDFDDGFGVRRTMPTAGAPGQSVASVGWSITNAAVAWGSGMVDNSRIWIYAWDDETGVGVQYANVSPALPTDQIFRKVRWSPNNAFFLCVQGQNYHDVQNPPQHMWEWSDETGYGVKIADPASYQLQNVAQDVGLSNAHGVFARVGNDNNGDGQPEIVIYAFDDTTGFGVALEALSVADSSWLDWSPDERALVFGHSLADSVGWRAYDAAIPRSMYALPPTQANYNHTVRFMPGPDGLANPPTTVMAYTFEARRQLAQVWSHDTGFGVERVMFTPPYSTNHHGGSWQRQGE